MVSGCTVYGRHTTFKNMLVVFYSATNSNYNKYIHKKRSCNDGDINL